MLKNLKHSMVLVLTIVMLLSIVFMSLAASKPVIPIEEKGISIPLDSITSEEWQGLGIVNFFSELDDYAEELAAYGFNDSRFLLDYHNTGWVASAHTSITRAVSRGVNITWGVSAGTTITKNNWAAFRQAVLNEALWSQNNGVYEFQIGNEIEFSLGFFCDIGTVSRTSNVITVTTPSAHGFTGNDQVTVFQQYWDTGLPAEWMGTFDITVIDATHFSYASVGDNFVSAISCRVSDISISDLISKIKTLATEVQAIFTNGNVSYALSYSYIPEWCASGKGDIDLISANIYQDNEFYVGEWFSDLWKDEIEDLIVAFGTDGMYISEFNLSASSINSWSEDESVQAAAIADMIDYIKSKGVERAFYYCWKDYAGGTFGIIDEDENYRKLLDVLISDTTVPSITGLSNDTTPTDSKTWTWDADEPATFRYLIDDKPDSAPTGDYSDTKTATQSGVEDGTYYIHVQAKDAAGNESEVVTVSAILDTTAPDTTEQTDETTQDTILDTTASNITGLSNDTTPTSSNESSSSSGGLSSSKSIQQYEDPVKAFVARFYQECLSRDPDNGGLNGWADDLASGAKTGAKVAYGFVFSDEFKQKNVSNEEYITILYRAFFNREPDSGGFNNWLRNLNNGKSRKWVLAGFIKSKEFKNLCAAYGIKPGSI